MRPHDRIPSPMLAGFGAIALGLLTMFGAKLWLLAGSVPPIVDPLDHRDISREMELAKENCQIAHLCGVMLAKVGILILGGWLLHFGVTKDGDGHPRAAAVLAGAVLLVVGLVGMSI